MNKHRITAVLLLALIGACGSPNVRDSSTSVDGAAVWKIDDAANIAYPTCWRCGADVDRSGVCDSCGAGVHIDAQTIVCPECHGSKVCNGCAPGHKCVACNSTHACAICEGTGKWRGDVCPDCEGGKICRACGPGAATTACERCNESHVCTNCDGTGTIVLK